MTTLAPAPTPHARFHPTLGLLGALAGRLGWRLWWPGALWLLTALAAWLIHSPKLTARGPSDLTIETGPSGALLLACLAAIPVLWTLGARYAAALGHDRDLTAHGTFALSLLVPAFWMLLQRLAAWGEVQLVGADAPLRVFAEEVGDKFGTESSPWGALWGPTLIVGGLWCATLAAVTAAVLARRWGVAFGVPLLVSLGIVALGLATYHAFTTSAGSSTTATDPSVVPLVVGLLAWALTLGALWWVGVRMFRRVPV